MCSLFFFVLEIFEVTEANHLFVLIESLFHNEISLDTANLRVREVTKERAEQLRLWEDSQLLPIQTLSN